MLKEKLPPEKLEEKHLDKELLLAFANARTNMVFDFLQSLVARLPVKKTLIYSLGSLALLLILTPLLTYLYFVRDLSSKENIINRKNAGVILTDRNDKPFFTLYEAKTKKFTPLKQIPGDTQHAIISIEDKDFYKHPGFSLRSLARAIFTDIERRALAQGGSTISQQLVKNTLLNQNKSFLRKYQEIFLAMEVERRFSKEDILEMYMNTVYFGEGAFGIEEAAHTYFNKTASDLTLAESALLAGILPAPSAYSPISGDKQKASVRQKLVLSQMQLQGYITPEQREKAEVEKIVFNPQDDGINDIAPHFALMVKDALIKKYGEQSVANSGFTVKTTLDLTAQEFAEITMKSTVLRLVRNKATNGAAVAIDPKTGEILALVGSHDWDNIDNGKINMVLRPRQPGSSFKPIVYAKAFEDHILTPGSILEDKEISFPGGYKPKNYDGKFRGKVSVRKALANSLNIPAVLAMEKIGIPDAIDMAERLGIKTLTDPSRYGLSLALGAAEIPLLQMTQAFSVFANKGIRNTPETIMEIKDKNGKNVYTSEPNAQSVLDGNITFLISSILSDNEARTETFGRSLTLSRLAAVKTGTTEDYRDSLTIGYTPSLVVGVWVGNNDRTPMDGVAGSSGAAPIWRAIMEHMLAGTARETFIQPTGVTKLTICKENGLKTEVATTSAYPEFFLRGTEPTKDCGISPTPTPTQQPSETPEPTDEPTNTPELTPSTSSEPTTTPINTPNPTLDLFPTISLP